MTLKDFLIFIRWKNVILISMIMFLIKFALFEKFELNVTLDNFHYFLLTISTVFIAIAGYIINDIYDVKADEINKPNRLFVGKKIGRTQAYNLFIAFNSVGLLIGMYLSHHIGHTSYFIIYVLTSLLLYQYAKQLKRIFIVSNVLVSFVVFLSIALPSVFDLLPVTNAFNESKQMVGFKLLLLFAVFGFFLTLLREIVKDMEDIKGDAEIEARTIPIVLGIKKTKAILGIITLFLFMAIVYFAYMLMNFDLSASIYLSIFVAIPLVYFVLDLWKTKDKKGFHRSSGILKLIMLMGILTILLI